MITVKKQNDTCRLETEIAAVLDGTINQKW